MITRSSSQLVQSNPELCVFHQYTAEALTRLRLDVCNAFNISVGKKKYTRNDNEQWCNAHMSQIIRAMSQQRIDLFDDERYPRKKQHSAAGHYTYFRSICIDQQRKNPTTVTVQDIQMKHKLLKITPGKCCYCWRNMATENDHWHSISNYGADNMLNKIPTCRSCNLKKGSTSPEQYIKTLRVGTKRSRAIAMRLERFEKYFKPTGKLDCRRDVTRRLKRYRPMVQKCFQLINQLVHNQAFIEETTDPENFMLTSFKSILGK